MKIAGYILTALGVWFFFGAVLNLPQHVPASVLIGYFAPSLFILVTGILALTRKPSPGLATARNHPLPPPIALPPPSTIPNHIYYFSAVNGITGPLTLEDIRKLYAARVLSPATYVHRAGDSQWRLLPSFPEISQ